MKQEFETKPLPFWKALLAIFGPLVLMYLTVLGLTTNTATRFYEAVDLWMSSLHNQIYLSLWVCVMLAIGVIAYMIRKRR